MVMRASWPRWLWATSLVAAIACSTRAAPEPPEPRKEVGEPSVPKLEACRVAECWSALADEAGRLGNTDVAASHRGQAFYGGRTTALLDAWIDALVAGGEVRWAHAAVEQALRLGRRDGREDLVEAARRRKAELAKIEEDGPIAVPPLSEVLQLAYTAERAGRLAEAVELFEVAKPEHPYHLARAGSVMARLGRMLAARQTWAAARTKFFERGVTLTLEVIGGWRGTAGVWRGEEFWVASRRQAMDDGEAADAAPLGVVRVYGGGGSREILLPRPSAVLAMTAGDQALLVGDGGQLVERDVLTGAVRRVVAGVVDGEVDVLTESGKGELLVGSREGGSPGLFHKSGGGWSPYGPGGLTKIDEFGRLRDEPTWATAVAMNHDGSKFAVAGSNATVGIWDYSVGGGYKLLPPPRPDPTDDADYNVAVALRYDAQERLVIVYRHGEVAIWDPATKQVVRRLTDRCEPAEAQGMVARRTAPGSPLAAPGEAGFQACGPITAADITADGRIASVGGGSELRVRSSEGRTLVLLRDGHEVPTVDVAWSSDGTIGLVDVDGTAAVLRPGSEVIERLAPRVGEDPRVEWLADGGRVLQVDGVAWDVETGERMARASEMRFRGAPAVVARLFSAEEQKRVLGAKLAPSGRALWLLMKSGVLQIWAPEAVARRIGTIYPLRSGGWLAVSHSGAVEGSEGAVNSVVTRIRGYDEALILPGEVGWDALHVPGAAARMLAGEDVPPPLYARPPAPRAVQR